MIHLMVPKALYGECQSLKDNINGWRDRHAVDLDLRVDLSRLPVNFETERF